MPTSQDGLRSLKAAVIPLMMHQNQELLVLQNCFATVPRREPLWFSFLLIVCGVYFKIDHFINHALSLSLSLFLFFLAVWGGCVF
jgi:hypothetical protein